MIDGPVLYELGIPGARVIAPGHPERSLVRHRLAISGQEQMPPLGRHEVDEEAVEAPTAWIAELGDSGEPMLPVARDDLEVTSYGAPLTFFPMANDGGDGLTIHDVVAAPVHGEVTVSSEGDRMTYVPDAGHSGTDLLSYRVRDALGRVSEPASIRVITGPEEASAEIRFADESGRLDGGETFSGVAMAVVDMDGDRHDDLVHFDGARELMIDYQIPQNSAFRGVVLGTFGESRVWSVVAGDLDHNGRPELLFGGYREGVRLLNFGENGNQNGGFAMSILENSDVFLQGSNLVDIDGDGLLDAFFCSDLSDNLKYRNTGNGVLVPAPGLIGTETREPSDNSGNYGSVWADVDGDLELYVSKCRQVATGPSDPRRINMLFRNDGTEGFFEVGKEAGLAVSAQSWASDFEDIDNDGDLDAFVGNHGDLSHLFVNQGDGRFTRESSARGISVGVKVMQALFRDLNNDGWLDLLITGELSRFYLNRGDETFIEAENLLTGGTRSHARRVTSIGTASSICLPATPASTTRRPQSPIVSGSIRAMPTASWR